jgi:hypothetical protein
VFAASAIGNFQIKVLKVGSWYSARETKNEKLVLCENSVSFISLRFQYVFYGDGELIISPIRMWQPPQPYIDDVPFAAGTPDLEDDPVALYLGYYDLNSMRQL